MEADMPVALVENGTSIKQRVVKWRADTAG